MIDADSVMHNVENNELELQATETISKIFLIKEKIEAVPVDQWKLDELTDYMFTLTKIMNNLSDLKDYAYIRAEALGEQYKSGVRDEYLRLKSIPFNPKDGKMTDSLAKAQAEAHCDPIKEEQLEAEHKARWLRSLYDDCERLISFSQSRMKSIIDDRIRSNISGT